MENKESSGKEILEVSLNFELDTEYSGETNSP
jgi:hypothetical protein